jgi:hypothetical protein
MIVYTFYRRNTSIYKMSRPILGELSVRRHLTNYLLLTTYVKCGSNLDTNHIVS